MRISNGQHAEATLHKSRALSRHRRWRRRVHFAALVSAIVLDTAAGSVASTVSASASRTRSRRLADVTVAVVPSVKFTCPLQVPKLFYAINVIEIRVAGTADECCQRCHDRGNECGSWSYGSHREHFPKKCMLHSKDSECPKSFPDNSLSFISGFGSTNLLYCFPELTKNTSLAHATTITSATTTTSAIPVTVAPGLQALLAQATPQATVPPAHTIPEPSSGPLPSTSPKLSAFQALPTTLPPDDAQDMLWWCLAMLTLLCFIFCLTAATAVYFGRRRNEQSLYIKEVQPNYNIVSRRSISSESTTVPASPLKDVPQQSMYVQNRNRYTKGFEDGAAHAQKQLQRQREAAMRSAVPLSPSSGGGLQGGGAGGMGSTGGMGSVGGHVNYYAQGPAQHNQEQEKPLLGVH